MLKLRMSLNFINNAEPHSMRPAASVLLAVLAALCFACGGSTTPSETCDADAGPCVFIALASNFDGYRGWPHVDAGVGADTGPDGGDFHAEGVRTAYINQLPTRSADAGLSEFPVGTMIVKTQEHLNDGGTGHTFAMVKRGGGYNANGAHNWEFFEVQDDGGSPVTIVWRGITPPAGEGYGGTSGGTCNTCHQNAAANDFVQTPALELKNF